MGGQANLSFLTLNLGSKRSVQEFVDAYEGEGERPCFSARACILGTRSVPVNSLLSGYLARGEEIRWKVVVIMN
jgi:hypothetical protein